MVAHCLSRRAAGRWLASGIFAASVVASSSTPSAHGEVAPAGRSRFAAEPLSLSIDSLTPSVIPIRGAIRVSGTITNTSTDTWDNLGVYPLTSFEPLTTPAALAKAARTDPADPVGDRITALGPLDVIETLTPGATATYSLRIPRSVLSISGAPGVYWFGIQALGEVDGVREETPFADGRARTFLPYLPGPSPRQAVRPRAAPPSTSRTPSPTGLVRTSLILPVRQDLTMLPDGRVDQVAEWAEQFGGAGRLRRLVDFGSAAGARSLTWLVDPALPDAAASIAAGNLPYDLSATVSAEGEPEPKPDPSPVPSPSSSPSTGTGNRTDPTPGPADPTTTTGGDEPDDVPLPVPGATPAQSAVALDWLNDLVSTLDTAGSTRLLALPYGDLDVAATAVRAPALLSAARERSDAAMARLELASRPGIAPPGGSLPPAAYPVIEPEETVLVTHRSFTEDPPERAEVDGRVLTTAPYVADGPAPADPRSPVSIRQMILSEAAVRLLRDTEVEHSYVAQLPPLWEAPDSTVDAAAFFAGLDGLDWFQLVPLASAPTQAASPVQPGDLAYPERQEQRELPADTVSAATALVARGDSLQSALTRNDRVADRVLDVALTTVSYSDRNAPRTARVVAERNRGWIADLLGEVTITGPPSLTLSSESGPLPATVTNGLDYPVTVKVVGRGDGSITVTGPRRVRLAPGERVGVILEISATTLGVHNLQLLLTDVDGRPLGGSTSLPVRSAQVGQVIWVIIGVGVTLLFAAIVLRLVRRVRSSRSGGFS